MVGTGHGTVSVASMGTEGAVEARSGHYPSDRALPGTITGRRTACRWCRPAAGVRLPAGSGRFCQPRALRASINFGNTLCTSPTIPRSATEKMGASWSLLMATMFFEFFMPTMCWVAPEIPHAM